MVFVYLEELAIWNREGAELSKKLSKNFAGIFAKKTREDVVDKLEEEIVEDVDKKIVEYVFANVRRGKVQICATANLCFRITM